MTPILRATDRVLTAVVALVLLAGAALVIGYGLNVPFARDAAARIDTAAVGRAPDWPWWSVALGAGGAIAILIGAWLLLLHLRPRSVRAVDTAHVGAVDLAHIADAAADDLARHPAVQSAKAVTRTAGGRPTVRITADIPPTTSAAQVRQLARHCAGDIRRAVDTDIEFQLLARPVPADRVRPSLA